jgi:hypothetical protein
MHRGLFTYDETVGYRYIADLTARIEHESGGYMVRTNGAGFRCRHEFVPERTPGTSRILLFGDSYTAADGVAAEHRYGDQLEALLPSTEVYNFGLPGTGTDQHYLLYRDAAPRFDHDLVVVSVFVENIRRVGARFRITQDQEGSPVALAKPYFELGPGGELQLHHVPVPKQMTPDMLDATDREHAYGGGPVAGVGFPRLRRIGDLLGPSMKDRLRRVMPYQPLPEYDRADHPDWLVLKAVLEQWRREATTPVVLCLLPTHFHVEGMASPTSYQQRFAELHQPPGMVVHDVLPAFHALSASARRACRFEHDPHFTPMAHRLVAESLAHQVTALLGAGVG